jgi:tetracycline repressor-like protein
VKRAIARGELSPKQNPSEIAASIMGPLFFRRWFSREPLDDTFVSSVVARVLASSKA